jgi:dienelactone hydrolase
MASTSASISSARHKSTIFRVTASALATVLTTVLATALTAGCSSSAKPSAAAGSSTAGPAVTGSGSTGAGPSPSPSITAACAAYSAIDSKRIVHFPSADKQETVEAYVTGQGGKRGTIGLVIDHQSQQTLCDSMSWADTFAAEGYLAIAPSLDENYQVTETEGAIAYLRAHGATKIVLIGASMGGTAVLQTAAEEKPPVQAVISLSGPESYYPLDALSAAPKLTVPVFYSAGSEDTEFASAEQDLYQATLEKAKELHIVQGSPDHGFDLVGTLLEAINAFIKDHAG